MNSRAAQSGGFKNHRCSVRTFTQNLKVCFRHYFNFILTRFGQRSNLIHICLSVPFRATPKGGEHPPSSGPIFHSLLPNNKSNNFLLPRRIPRKKPEPVGVRRELGSSQSPPAGSRHLLIPGAVQTPFCLFALCAERKTRLFSATCEK